MAITSKIPYNTDKNINIIDIVIQNIFNAFKTLKVELGNTLNSFMPHENTKKTISNIKKIIGNINKTTPSPFSIPFKLFIKP